jgi:hypothetical protein
VGRQINEINKIVEINLMALYPLNYSKSPLIYPIGAEGCSQLYTRVEMCKEFCSMPNFFISLLTGKAGFEPSIGVLILMPGYW